MCGICFICFRAEIWNQLNQVGEPASAGANCVHNVDLVKSMGIDTNILKRRGPDRTYCAHCPLSERCEAYLTGCVLHLRGKLTQQPLAGPDGSQLLWNGEIFGGIEIKEQENDTEVLFQKLSSCTKAGEILQIFQQIHGPWAVIYWQASSKTLWFGRDMFGRRSLLWHLPENCADVFVLSSVALGKQTYKEIPSVGIFSMDFSDVKSQSDHLTSTSPVPNLTLYPWAGCLWPRTRQLVLTTPAEDIMGYLYPNSEAPAINVIVKESAELNRWIPTPLSIGNEADQHSQILVENFDMYGPADSAGIDQKASREFSSEGDELACSKTTVHNKFVAAETHKNCATQTNGDNSSLATGISSSTKDLIETLGKILEDRADLHPLMDKLICELEKAVFRRVNNLTEDKKLSLDAACSSGETSSKSNARIAILFSGGLDSTLLAALADRCLPEGEAIDLLNVAFEQSPPSVQNMKSNKAKRSQRQKSNKRPQAVQSVQQCSSEVPISDGLEPIHSNLQGLEVVEQYKDNGAANLDPEAATSLDSRCLGSLSQIPVSPSNSICDEGSASFDPYNVPDRQTARTALSELNAKRPWNFIEINVSQAELQRVRQERISSLIYPLNTVLDDSIGCAVWFAARGQGVVSSDRKADHALTSSAQILLCGMAADELFAGYSRHRVTHKTKGWEGLEQEIEDEIYRISTRNLGRDDRIIADHGKEARFPYLDENFVQLVSQIPLKKRVDFSYPRGVGEKLLLRLCALKLGLAKTASQAKRAIQFGSKIAKLDNRKEKGSDICDRISSTPLNLDTD